MNKENARTLAIRVLSWVVKDDYLCKQFLTLSGQTPAELAQNLDNTGLLLAILDFLMTNDAWIVEFCDCENLPYSSINTAKTALAGKNEINWT